MADIRINQLPAATGDGAPVASDFLPIDGATTRKATIQQVADAGIPVASQPEAQAGINNAKRMTPLTTKQSIASEVGVTLASAAQGSLAESALQPSDIPSPVGDMVKSVYDPTNKNADAFNRTNHYGPNIPDDSSVTSAKIASSAVTRGKIEPNLSTATIRYNIREWGTNGQAFVDAHAAIPAGQPIVVPAGTYDMGGVNRNLTGRRVILQGAVIFTNGDLIGALEERTDAGTGTRSFGTGVAASGSPHQADYKFGDTLNNIVRHGLVFGGANPRNGTDGTRFSLDSYSGWAVAQNTKYGGAQEFAFQPNAISGIGNRYAGENRIYTTYDMFVASHVGKYFYFSDQVYRISAVNGPRDITVTNIDGSAVSWSSTREGAAVMMVWVGGNGTGAMNGDTLTRSSGDPFVVKGVSKYYCRVNGGTIYEVNVWISPNTITLIGANFPAGTAVTYEFWTTINNLSSRVVVQRGNGFGGPEECVSLEAYADGKFKLQALSSVGTFPFAVNQKPFHIGNGYFSGGGERTHILLDGVQGDTFIGGVYARATLRVTNGDNSPTPTGIIQYQRPSGSGAPTPNRYFEFMDDSGAIARVPYQRM